MNPNEINKLKEKAPFPLLILLILFFIPGLLLNPELEELKSSNSVHDLSLTKARGRVKADVELQRKLTRLNATREIMKQVGAVVPEESELPGLINRLHKLAGENSVVLEDVSYAMQKKFENLDVPGFRIIMSLTAGYTQMRGFLEAVESMESPVLINEILLTETGKYALTIRMLTK